MIQICHDPDLDLIYSSPDPDPKADHTPDPDPDFAPDPNPTPDPDPWFNPDPDPQVCILGLILIQIQNLI